MKARKHTMRLAVAASLGLGLLAQVGVVQPAAAQASNAARIREMQRVIEEQQRQLESQARTLQLLQQQVESLNETTEATKETVANISEQPKVTRSGNDKVKLTLSGQINRGVLVTDDGENTEVFNVDNDNSSTRVRFVGQARPTEDLTVGTNFEVQFESNSTADVNQRNKRNVGPNSFTERKIEAFFDSKRFGRLWVGQGDTASNGTSEVDLSGTSVVGYSSIADMAGGILFVDRDTDELSDITIGDVFSNLDGLSRDDRVRYDTPSFYGFKGAGSWVTDGRYDLALRYGGDFGQFKTAGALAYSDRPELKGQWNGSISALHESGFNGTFAAGNRRVGRGRDNPTFWYLKLGYIAQLTSLGKTAFSIDYTRSEDVQEEGDTATSYGAFAVQKLDEYGTELYLGLRNHELSLDRPETDTQPKIRRVHDVFAVLGGARVKF